MSTKQLLLSQVRVYIFLAKSMRSKVYLNQARKTYNLIISIHKKDNEITQIIKLAA